MGTRVVVQDPVPFERWTSVHAMVEVLRRDLEDKAKVKPCWVLSGIEQLRSVCAVSLCSGHRLSRYTRIRMRNGSQRVLRTARPSSHWSVFDVCAAGI